jgi:chorismate mutase
LRWYDAAGNWILTPEERERRQVERLTEQLRSLGVEPDLDDDV